MTKIAINDCYGGFSISPKTAERYAELKGFKLYWFERANPRDFNSEKLVPCEAPTEAKGVILGPSCYTSPDAEDGTYFSLHWSDEKRDDPLLIQAIEELGTEEASGALASLKVVEIPDDVEWTIQEYDGIEWIAEAHRTWE